MPSASDTQLPINIGVSSCILGEAVRYNAGHKLDRFVRDDLGAFVDFVPVCPEVGIGLGVPRETLRLVSKPGGDARLVAPTSGSDHTAKMAKFATKQCAELARQELCGFILQKGSPSCGMERVKLYPKVEGGVPRKSGVGVFARALMERFPLLPIEEAGRLNDPRLRENFVERIFAYRRVRTLFTGRWKLRDVIDFHANEKLLLMAHNQSKVLGQLVAKANSLPRPEFKAAYQRQFLQLLATPSTIRKHCNVLQHISGYFRKQLDDDSRAELREVIEDYRHGLVPVIVPITLCRHHIRRLGIEYLQTQSYLNPHPRELMLRNRV